MLNFALLLLAAFSAAPQAQYGTPGIPHSSSQTGSRTNCPWLTEGSAAKVLGGNVSVMVAMTNIDEGSCKFVRQQDSTDSLEVLVNKAALITCSAENIRLQGIGNNAARCKLPGPHKEVVEMVSSQVRDLHFTVTLTYRRQENLTKAADAQGDILEQIAEQVAGNLY
jgi:hypothetical protein